MKNFLVLFAMLALLFSCSREKITPYDFGFYFTKDDQQDIMAKIISYIYITPKGVNKADRYNPDQRPFYLKETENFKMIRFYKDQNDRYYFYLVRPARNVRFDKRGVAGVFTLKADGEIDYFEEVFVTKMIPEQSVIDFGNLVFEDFVEGKGKIQMNPAREGFIEFPSFMSQYDFEKKEWTYKEPDFLD